jgi:type II secretory pathway pseudopilin PulG
VTMLLIVLIVIAVLLLTGGFGYSRRSRRGL